MSCDSIEEVLGQFKTARTNVLNIYNISDNQCLRECFSTVQCQMNRVIKITVIDRAVSKDGIIVICSEGHGYFLHNWLNIPLKESMFSIACLGWVLGYGFNCHSCCEGCGGTYGCCQRSCWYIRFAFINRKDSIISSRYNVYWFKLKAIFDICIQLLYICHKRTWHTTDLIKFGFFKTADQIAANQQWIGWNWRAIIRKWSSLSNLSFC